MPTLATELRNQLERVIIQARDVAEAGARAALEALAVRHCEPYGHMTPENRQLRNHLRARARQLGDRQDRSGRLVINHLIGECAYEHWHRMLFARLLAENGLLIEPEMGVAMSLAEAEELAKDEGVDVWVFASRRAQQMLPQIFRPEDPLLQLTLATEHLVELERLLDSLPKAVFTASDALGWVYQFWQSKRKDEVNRSEVKVGADEISAVTQLFTEPYMVEFLLHNTLGAWWAGKQLSEADASGAKSEDELRRKLALPGMGWEYLRFVRGDDGEGGPWRPAAGTFDGWPKQAKDIKVLDPCCGSGHFLVAAIHHLVPIRMAEEGLSAAEAVEAVLRDNLHGLEIDERCCQIAAFALALVAWTYPDAGGYRELPELHIACTGIGPQSTQEQWVKLAEESGVGMPTVGREAIKNGLLNLHRLFSQAPTLGSLINPAELPADLIAADYETIQPYLNAIREVEKADDETRERAIAAAGMIKAADLLAGDYTLVITNVPYLGRGNQSETLKTFAETHYKQAKADLATIFVDRMLKWTGSGQDAGTVAAVTPQNWLFLTSYKKLRERLLKERSWNIVARLGPGAFETIGGHVVNVALLGITGDKAGKDHIMAGVDVSAARTAAAKSALLRGEAAADASAASPHPSPASADPAASEHHAPDLPAAARAAQAGTPPDNAAPADESVRLVPQAEQVKNPDGKIGFTVRNAAKYLMDLAVAPRGIVSGDGAFWTRAFWELLDAGGRWEFLQSAVSETCLYGGRSEVISWHTGGEGMLRPGLGNVSLSFRGVAISQVGTLPCSIYDGDRYDNSTFAIVPHEAKHLLAIWAFCSSPWYHTEVRRFNQKLSVDPSHLLSVPFDLAHWQKVAAEKYPDGLPEPQSNDPTQWLFHGHPAGMLEGGDAREPSPADVLQVAVARLLGYRWPAELDKEMRLDARAREWVHRCDELLPFADNDGIVCIPAVRGEEPAAERLLRLLAACDIGPRVDLDDWLRNDFFQEHCELFHQRPFVWHVWDGRKRDGFHALVNYHKLCEGGGDGRKLLESLTYSYLGDWINRCKDEVRRGEGGAEDRVAAAVALQDRLKAIIAGEPPFDLFVRWKPLTRQPIGWEPDINDGVRVNIRPFVALDLPKPVCPGARKGAGVLRYKPNIKWTKDRGKEPQRPRDEYPWFWDWDGKTEDFMGGNAFDGVRHNACHYTNRFKHTARYAAGKGKS